MNSDIYTGILATLKDSAYSGVASYSRYNEPLAHEIIIERIRQARSCLPDALLHLNTNGDYLSKEVVGVLCWAGLISLNVQVYLPKQFEYVDSVVSRLVADEIEKYGLKYELTEHVPGERIGYCLEYKDMSMRIYARNFAVN